MKSISYEKYLTTLALFTVASQHYRKAREMEWALCEELGIKVENSNPYADQISDALYSEDGSGFDTALKFAGYAVEPAPPPSGQGRE